MPAARALLEGLIDYAGLFPPAELGVPAAVAEYLTHRREPAAFMLARFVCPGGRLVELALALAEHPDEPPVPLAVLGRGGGSTAELLTGLDQDLAALRRVAFEHGRRLAADVIEIKLPAQDVEAAVGGIVERTSSAAPWPLRAFCEPSLLGDWRPRLERAAAALSGTGAGLKIRCGGLEAAAVPTVEAVAAAITAARDASLPLKATQGLHHPVRHHDAALDTTVHGFLNLIAAGIMARVHGLDEAGTAAIVAERDPAAFSVTADALTWRELEASAAQVAAARREAVVGFGSCSFAEPRDDLASLGLLPAPPEETPHG